jgi:hypothetical protein
LDLLQCEEIRPSELVEKAIVFLSDHFKPSLLKPCHCFLVRFFKADIINAFPYQGVSKLIGALIKKSPEELPVIVAMRHLLAFTWNRKGPECLRVKRAFLL